MSEDISFGEASAQALASMEASQTPAAPETSASVVPDTPAAVVPETPVADPPPTPPAGNRFKVKVRGEELEVDEDELLKGYSRHGDYTRSKQELAEQVRANNEAKAAIEAEKTRYAKLVGDDPTLKTAMEVSEKFQVTFTEALKAVLDHQAKAAAVPAVNNDEIATVGQATEIAQRQMADLLQKVKDLEANIEVMTAKQIAAAKADIVTSQQAANYTNELNATLSTIATQLPILTNIDSWEDVLRYKVVQANPATMEEAKDLFVKFAEEQAGKLTAHFNQTQKAKVAAKASLATNGIEPPGGAGIVPTPSEHKFGSKELAASAEAYLRSVMK